MVWNQFWDRVLLIRIELRDQNDVQNRADRQTDPQLLRAVKSCISSESSCSHFPCSRSARLEPPSAAGAFPRVFAR